MNKVKEMAMNTVGIILGVALVVMGWGAFAWTVGYFANSGKQAAEPTSEAMDNTERRAYESAMRNEFVSGCLEDGSISLEECQCMLSQLESLYDDLLYNEARINQILRDGFSERDVDAMLECFGYTDYNTI